MLKSHLNDYIIEGFNLLLSTSRTNSDFNDDEIKICLKLKTLINAENNHLLYDCLPILQNTKNPESVLKIFDGLYEPNKLIEQVSTKSKLFSYVFNNMDLDKNIENKLLLRLASDISRYKTFQETAFDLRDLDHKKWIDLLLKLDDKNKLKLVHLCFELFSQKYNIEDSRLIKDLKEAWQIDDLNLIMIYLNKKENYSKEESKYYIAQYKDILTEIHSIKPFNISRFYLETLPDAPQKKFDFTTLDIWKLSCRSTVELLTNKVEYIYSIDVKNDALFTI